ncbi:hypothetical protein [Methylophaga sp. OBS4]|uniref:hypothetical protein n=1 Tax=Methylophaga sp. OBS4 TaxID=2991935 RepID=UPI002256E9DA|nr:hypothetical protein [Methylophaga sp. OBS4]MCX4186263.1 hypothetical protein [Methylophaga sp. OBS4]
MATQHLQSLELAAQGDWDGAHRLIQIYEDELSCLVHGYLHRVEGDTSNAAYWYKRAGQTLPANSLPDEFDRLYELAKQI